MPKTWHVPQDPPSDFITNVKRWLNKCLPYIESLSDQELKERMLENYPGMHLRRWINEQLDKLRRLEQGLKPVEWLAQCVWNEAGKMGLFDFDDLYGMVGPLDDVAFGPSQADKSVKLRSKLDELLSRTLDANGIVDELSALIDLPVIGIRVNRLSTTIKLERSVWALLIGIDNYSQAPLRCAVADAEAMFEFLTNRLSVPQDHITKLLARNRSPSDHHKLDDGSSREPTRQNILSELWSLHQNERIRHGDTIIVFYAGHGAVYSSGGVLRSAVRVEKTDRDWNSFYQRNRINLDELVDSPRGPFIDSIVPADRGQLDSDPSYLGRYVPDICDRELNMIFNITRQMKGPNILFIADCCYSASVARSGPDMTKWRNRALPPLRWDDMQEMLLRAQWNIDTRALSTDGIRSVMDIEWTPDLSSFVTLAACRRDQTAKEHFKQNNGLFTGVLLDTLESDAVDKNTTFEGLIQHVAEKLSDWQVPVVHGDGKHLRLWFRED